MWIENPEMILKMFKLRVKLILTLNIILDLSHLQEHMTPDHSTGINLESHWSMWIVMPKMILKILQSTLSIILDLSHHQGPMILENFNGSNSESHWPMRTVHQEMISKIFKLMHTITHLHYKEVMKYQLLKEMYTMKVKKFKTRDYSTLKKKVTMPNLIQRSTWKNIQLNKLKP